jgi:hypothetical protein
MSKMEGLIVKTLHFKNVISILHNIASNSRRSKKDLMKLWSDLYYSSKPVMFKLTIVCLILRANRKVKVGDENLTFSKIVNSQYKSVKFDNNFIAAS